MTTTLTKPRTASIIVDTDGDGFKIQHMFFNGDKVFGVNKETPDTVDHAVACTLNIIIDFSHRPTSVFITISAAKRMTDEQIAAIQAAALETRT